MYGLVNQAIKDLVREKFGEDTWERVRVAAHVEVREFVGLDYYDDKITYDLVFAASKELNLSPEEVLKAFGQYWILYTAQVGYGPMMDLFGSNFKDCLQNLDSLHGRMGMTMPNLRPPKFTFTDHGNGQCELEYKSERAGLCPMVIGLIEGLAIKHNTDVAISLDESDKSKKVFKMQIKERAA